MYDNPQKQTKVNKEILIYLFTPNDNVFVNKRLF